MDELFQQDNKWFVKGSTTTDFAHYVSIVLHKDLCKGQYTVGTHSNPRKFTVFSMDNTGLTSHFVIYIYHHKDGRHTLVIYEVRDPLLAEKFIADIQKQLKVHVVLGNEEYHDFDLRADIDSALVSKLIQHIKEI